MRIAVINEISACAKNKDILLALHKTGNDVINAGMQEPTQKPELTYIHTGLMAALLLWTDAADLVVGGCGTGQGFLNSTMQYTGVFCGLVSDPLDAFLFGQINGGNCISLALNKGYGWAGGINLEYIFEKLFSMPFGNGYPPERSESQLKSRNLLKDLSERTHRPMEDIIAVMDKDILQTVFSSTAFMDCIKCARCADKRDYLLGLTGK
jgi:ribose 5-phosphate isomerase RpiB